MYVDIIERIKNKFKIALLKIQHLTDIIFLLKVLVFKEMNLSLHVVLVEPEIPQNTGNIARTCAATNTTLHLVRPLGFNIDEKSVRRAGLDYWRYVDLIVHDSLISSSLNMGMRDCSLLPLTVIIVILISNMKMVICSYLEERQEVFLKS